MRYNKLATLVFFLALCSAPYALFAITKHMTLKEAIAGKAISMRGIGNGGARGKCLRLELTNRTRQPITVTVDPAMIFVPSDTNYQNLVAAGNESVDLEPGACKELSVETFCGKSYASCPTEGLRYGFWKQGEPAMVNTMNFIRENNFMDDLGQNAVWSFTNGHSLGRIYRVDEQERSKKLVEYVAGERHMPVPEYFTAYNLNHTPGGNMIVANSARHYVEMEWKNATVGYNRMNVLVYREDGTFYKAVNGNDVCDHTGHKVTVKFDPKVDKGNFYVVLKDDYSNIYDRKNISVGID